MRFPPPSSSIGNGETPPRMPSSAPSHFHSTMSIQKLRRFNILILVFRFACFCFSFAAAIFMVTNSHNSRGSPSWHDFEAFRFVLAANSIAALYSLAEMGASIWEILRGNTFFPETIQVWFDFGHDQVFAYLLLSADAAGAALVRTFSGGDTCTTSNTFCVQSYISIGLGFVGFLFLGFSSLLSGFRVVSFIINGSRFHL